MAETQNDTQKKTAVRRLVRGPDGRVHVVFVDADTGKQLQNIDNYHVIDSFQQQQEQLGISPLQNDKPADKTTAEQVKQSTVNEGKGNNSNATDQQQQNGGGQSNPAPRGMSNDFGFMQEPAALGAVGFMPGVVGAIGKAANVGFNVNNVAASNAARETLGLDRLGAKDTVKGALGFGAYDDGKVADVNIGTNGYTVDFGGVTTDNRTALTPNEARQRSMVTGQPIQEATPAQAAANAAAANTHRSGIGGLFDAAKGFAGNIFGGLWQGAKQVLSIDQPRVSPTEFDYVDTSYYPDAPTQSSGFSGGSNADRGTPGPVDSNIGAGIGSNGWGYSGDAVGATNGSYGGNTGGGFGGSGQADAARGSDGLY